MEFTLFFSSILILAACCIAEVNRPRGVSISKASLYKPGKTFTCFDGSSSIAFEYINDDYCDCPDGSDEPGTSACPNGSFHCTNAGHRPSYILSSRVNDGICDCCDGTDEYGSGANCQNTCKELGKKAREEDEKLRLLVEEGHTIYKDYVKQADETLKQKQKRKEELARDKAEIETQRNELESLKNEAEIPEKEAKDEFKKQWEEERDRKKKEMESFRLSDAFSDLDANQDNIITVEEVQNHLEFDIDANGEVSNEEALEYLEDHDSLDFNTFADKVWPNIRDIYKAKVEAVPEEGDQESQGEAVGDGDAPPEGADDLPPPPEPMGNEDQDLGEEDRYPPEDYFDENDDHDEDDDDDDDSEMGDDGEYNTKASTNSDSEDQMPPYDENTQALIDAADKSREEFNEVDKKFKEIESELRSLEEELNVDYGPNKEFYSLRGQCFDYTESQYTYKLCPFDRASQRGKSGGSETSLGRWGRWDGPGDNLYSVMLLDRGQNCWNGPDRSVRVKIECGKANEVFAASEPNRCEYEYKFASPAACSSGPEAAPKDSNHDEL